ncbi:MAG: hypothetical protein AAB513_01180 [Patescibacteria group bacterium]
MEEIDNLVFCLFGCGGHPPIESILALFAPVMSIAVFVILTIIFLIKKIRKNKGYETNPSLSFLKKFSMFVIFVVVFSQIIHIYSYFIGIPDEIDPLLTIIISVTSALYFIVVPYVLFCLLYVIVKMLKDRKYQIFYGFEEFLRKVVSLNFLFKANTFVFVFSIARIFFMN